MWADPLPARGAAPPDLKLPPQPADTENEGTRSPDPAAGTGITPEVTMRDDDDIRPDAPAAQDPALNDDDLTDVAGGRPSGPLPVPYEDVII